MYGNEVEVAAPRHADGARLRLRRARRFPPHLPVAREAAPGWQVGHHRPSCGRSGTREAPQPTTVARKPKRHRGASIRNTFPPSTVNITNHCVAIQLSLLAHSASRDKVLMVTTAFLVEQFDNIVTIRTQPPGFLTWQPSPEGIQCVTKRFGDKN